MKKEYNYQLWIKTTGSAWINIMNYNYSDIEKELNQDTPCYIAHKQEQSVIQNGVFKLQDLGKRVNNSSDINYFTKDNKILMYKI